MVKDGPESKLFPTPEITRRSKQNPKATTSVTTTVTTSMTTSVTTSVTEDNEENDGRLDLTDERLLRTGTNEDHTKFRAEGFEVDDDNEPAPENIPEAKEAQSNETTTGEEDNDVEKYDTKYKQE